MKRITLAAVILITLGAGLATAEDRYPGFRIAVNPVIDVPLPSEARMFQPAGGAAVSGRYVLPGFRPLAAGIVLGYHLGRMQHPDLGDLGWLSVISAEATAELRATLGGVIDLCFAGGAGYFFAFANDALSSSASNLVWSAGVGLDVRTTATLSIGIQGEYRSYEGLYHIVSIGIGADLQVGGVN